jgi:periplasmic protein TonB
MENQSKTPETLDDFIFQNRNKTYGAYVLRSDYQKVIIRSLIIGTALVLLALLSPVILAKEEKQDDKKIVTITMRDLDIPKPPIDEPKPIEPEMPKPQQEKVNSQAFNAFKVVPDDVLTELPPTQDELADSKVQISNETITDGVDFTGEAPVQETDKVGSGTEPTPVEIAPEPDSKEWISVEVMPEFAGGMKALINFLQKNLHYPSQAQRANIGGKVYVNFVVGSDGTITKIDVLKGVGFGCDEEAERVVKLMPNWNPGKQTGRNVAVRFTLPIAFQLQE